MNKKNIVLFALVCGVVYQDAAGALTSVVRGGANASKTSAKTMNRLAKNKAFFEAAFKEADDVAKLAAKKAEDLAKLAAKNGDDASKAAFKEADDVAKLAAKKADGLAKAVASKSEALAKAVAKEADDASKAVAKEAVDASKTVKSTQDVVVDARKSLGSFTEELANTGVKKSLREQATKIANDVIEAIKRTGQAGWDGINQGLSTMKKQISTIARNGDEAMDEAAKYLVKQVGWDVNNIQTVARMKKALYATAGTAVVGGGVGIGMAVHNKNKKNQSTQGQDTQQPAIQQPATQQPATQQPATQQQDTQSGWQGFLYN